MKGLRSRRWRQPASPGCPPAIRPAGRHLTVWQGAKAVATCTPGRQGLMGPTHDHLVFVLREYGRNAVGELVSVRYVFGSKGVLGFCRP